MKKIIKLTVLTAFTVAMGILFGAMLFKYFLYSQIVFLTLNLSLVVLLIFSAAKALNTYKKGEDWAKMMSDFGLAMSEPFHRTVKQFKLNSILIVGMVFGFIGCLSYLETKDVGYFMLFALLPASYLRALLTYQKFKEFR